MMIEMQEIASGTQISAPILSPQSLKVGQWCLSAEQKAYIQATFDALDTTIIEADNHFMAFGALSSTHQAYLLTWISLSQIFLDQLPPSYESRTQDKQLNLSRLRARVLKLPIEQPLHPERISQELARAQARLNAPRSSKDLAVSRAICLMQKQSRKRTCSSVTLSTAGLGGMGASALVGLVFPAIGILGFLTSLTVTACGSAVGHTDEHRELLNIYHDFYPEQFNTSDYKLGGHRITLDAHVRKALVTDLVRVFDLQLDYDSIEWLSMRDNLALFIERLAYKIDNYTFHKLLKLESRNLLWPAVHKKTD